MLSAEDAADAVRLENELDQRCDGLVCCHAAILATEGNPGVGSTPEPDPETSYGLAA